MRCYDCLYLLLFWQTQGVISFCRPSFDIGLLTLKASIFWWHKYKLQGLFNDGSRSQLCCWLFILAYSSQSSSLLSHFYLLSNCYLFSFSFFLLTIYMIGFSCGEKYSMDRYTKLNQYLPYERYTFLFYFIFIFTLFYPKKTSDMKLIRNEKKTNKQYIKTSHSSYITTTTFCFSFWVTFRSRSGKSNSKIPLFFSNWPLVLHLTFFVSSLCTIVLSS